MNHQLKPFEINPDTGEPFLRLRKHRNIIVTPPRIEDAPHFIPILNDVRVWKYFSFPYPYTMDHATEFIDTSKKQTDSTLEELENAKDDPFPIIVGQCPVRYLREVKENGMDTLIGEVSIMRCVHGELMGPDGGVDWENKIKRREENNSIPVGDPNILWSMSTFLAPSYHGKGIMTDAVGTLLHEWGIPRMNIRRMWVSAFIGNEGSVKVFKRNSFKLIGTYEDFMMFRGTSRGLHLLEWKYGY